MGIYRNIKSLFEKRSAQQYDLQGYLDNVVFANRHRDVMSHPIIRRGVTLIANTAANLPINVYKDGGKKGRQVDDANEWQFKLNVRPTPWCNRTTWIQTMLRDAIVHGNSYHFIGSDGDFIWMDPHTTEVTKTPRGLVYAGYVNDQYLRLSQDRVIHIRGLTKDGIVGESLAEALPDAIASGLAMYQHIRNYFANGTFSSLLVYMPPGASKDDESAKFFKKRFNEQYGNISNSYKNIFLGGETKVEPIAANNQTSQVKELMEFDIVVVAGLLGLPPSTLGANQNTSYASLEFETLKELKDINFWLLQVEEELTSKLMSEDDLATGKRWIEFNRAAFVETDKNSEMDLLLKGLNNSVYSLEYVRRKLNANIEFIDGETYFHPSNLVKVVHGEEPVEPPAPPAPPQNLQDLGNETPSENSEDAPSDENTDESEARAIPDSQEQQNLQLEKLLEKNLKRLIKRIGNSNKSAYEHRSVWMETLDDFANAEKALDYVAKYLDGLSDSKPVAAENMKLEPIMELLK